VYKEASAVFKKGKSIMGGIVAGVVSFFVLSISACVYCWYRCARKTMKTVAAVADAA